MESNQIPVPESTKRILGTIKDDLFPELGRIKDILVRLQRCRISFQIFSFKLSKLESEYWKVSDKLFTAVRKLETPDILFEGLEEAESIIEYFRYLPAFKDNIAQALSYIEIVDRILDRKAQSIQNKRTFLVSVIAILVGILSIDGLNFF